MVPFRWVDEIMKEMLVPWPNEVKAAELPRFELKEEPERFVVVAELPGFKPEEVTVQLVGNRIHVKGKHEEKGEKEGRTYHRFGEFERLFELPENTAPEKVAAEMAEGLLKIILPKIEAQKPVAVPVAAPEPEKAAPIIAAEAEKVA
jgi:HSP20 family protein